MVIVSHDSSDQNTAWRIRDALATHPLLGGATAHIEVSASHDCVILNGWTHDSELGDQAIRLAMREAGKRAVCHFLTDRRDAPQREPT